MFGSGNKSIPGVPYDVQRVYNCLTPKPKELLVNAYQRRFIRDGEIGLYNHKERRTKKRHLFLFNDVLLIAKNEGKNKYWLKVYISLRTTLRIEDVPDTSTIYKVEFRIYAPKRTFIMFTKSEPDKLAWIKDIKAAIAGEYSKGNSPNNSNTVHVETSSNFERRTNIDVLQDKPKEEKKLEFSGDIGTIDIPGMDFNLPAGSEFQDESDSDDDTTFSTIGGGPASNQPQGNVIDFLSQPSTTDTPSQQPPVQHQPMQTQPMASPLQPTPFGGSQPFANSKPLTPVGMLEPTKADASPTINSGPAPTSVSSADPFSALKGLSAENPQSPYGGMQQQQPMFGNAGGIPMQQPYSFGQPQQPQYNLGQQQPQQNYQFGQQQQQQPQQNQPYQFGQF